MASAGEGVIDGHSFPGDDLDSGASLLGIFLDFFPLLPLGLPSLLKWAVFEGCKRLGAWAPADGLGGP